jgi:hypothetical protein
LSFDDNFTFELLKSILTYGAYSGKKELLSNYYDRFFKILHKNNIPLPTRAFSVKSDLNRLSILDDQ